MPHLATYVTLAGRSEQTLAEAFRTVAEGHAVEAGVFHMCTLLAGWCDDHVRRLQPVVDRHADIGAADDVREPERLHAAELTEVRTGPVGLLRDLQDLMVLATLVQTTWTVVDQCAQGARDEELQRIAEQCNHETSRQLKWLNTRLKAAAPQALLVAT